MQRAAPWVQRGSVAAPLGFWVQTKQFSLSGISADRRAALQSPGMGRNAHPPVAAGPRNLAELLLCSGGCFTPNLAPSWCFYLMVLGSVGHAGFHSRASACLKREHQHGQIYFPRRGEVSGHAGASLRRWMPPGASSVCPGRREQPSGTDRQLLAISGLEHSKQGRKGRLRAALVTCPRGNSFILDFHLLFDL